MGVEYRRSSRLFLRRCLELRANLRQLLLDLLCRSLDVGPVEPQPRRAILKSVRAVQSRKSGGEPLRDALSLTRLHSLPRLLRGVTVKVGMPSPHLGDQTLGHVGKRKSATFFCDHGVK